jgi:hypothetical protein
MPSVDEEQGMDECPHGCGSKLATTRNWGGIYINVYECGSAPNMQSDHCKMHTRITELEDENAALREQRDWGFTDYGEGAVDEFGESYYNPVWLEQNVKNLTCYDLDNLCFAIGEYEYQRQKDEANNEQD